VRYSATGYVPSPKSPGALNGPGIGENASGVNANLAINLREQCEQLANSTLACDGVKEPEKYHAAYLAAQLLQKYGGPAVVNDRVMVNDRRQWSAFLRLAAALYGNRDAKLWIQCVAVKRLLREGIEIEGEPLPPGLG